MPNEVMQTLTIGDTTYDLPSGGGGVSMLSFTNKTASSWTSDSTYSGYGYKCVITCTGVTSSHYVEVTFSPADIALGVLCPVCTAGTNSVTIYSSDNTLSLTIPTIVAFE